jgi:hypothetical protein
MSSKDSTLEPIDPAAVRAAAEEIADVAGVPTDWRRQEFVLAVIDLVKEADSRTAVVTYARKHEKDLKRGRAAALNLRDAMDRLDGLVDVGPVKHVLAELSLLLGLNPAPDKKPPGKRGPKPDSGSYWLFRWFVRELHGIVRRAGGKFTLTKIVGSDEPDGTLIVALEILQPYVGCIPHRMSYNALDDIRKLSPAEKTALDVLKRMVRRGPKAKEDAAVATTIVHLTPPLIPK